MASRVCRLCSDVMEAKRATNLFSAVGMQNNWVSRITALLDVVVSRDDGLSLYICIKCKLRIVSLEKSLADLEAFKHLVRCSGCVLERVRGPLKRTKVTSSDVGVSPDILKERPCSKLSRKRLSFESKSKRCQNV